MDSGFLPLLLLLLLGFCCCLINPAVHHPGPPRWSAALWGVPGVVWALPRTPAHGARTHTQTHHG